MDQSTTVLFGLPGVRVRRVDQVESGARVVHVETAEGGSAASCPGCGVVSVSVKENVVPALLICPTARGRLRSRGTRRGGGAGSPCVPG